MVDKTTRKIMTLPRSEFTEERLISILENHSRRIKLEMKNKILIILIECLNKQMTISEAVVMINNLEDGQ